MVISREDIDAIAVEVAKQVLNKAQACRCGSALWEASKTLRRLNSIIDDEKPDRLGRELEFVKRDLGNTEQYCHIDVSEAKELSQVVAKNIEQKNWREATSNLANLYAAVIGPIQECAEEG